MGKGLLESRHDAFKRRRHLFTVLGVQIEINHEAKEISGPFRLELRVASESLGELLETAALEKFSSQRCSFLFVKFN